MPTLTIKAAPPPGPIHRPAMSNTIDRHHHIALTSAYVELDGVPTIPVAGEIHYSRLPRHRWAERLAYLRSGGITVAASYIFWNHHEPIEGQASFEGNLDLAAFVREAQRAGLLVALRPGPWVHAESRHGGLPNWVAEAGHPVRQDDPTYLAKVATWFGRLGDHLNGLLGPDSPVVVLQVENELYDNPAHLLTLKRLMREAGLVAPIWTATAWGSANLPVGEVMPQFGGYGDGFWVPSHEGWHHTFRAHYHFSTQWDDPGIGSDVRESPVLGASPSGPLNQPSPDFPIATCELGGGMATAYHRRPAPAPLDVATIALTKIGQGSAWQGYYLYAGGTNPHRELPVHESHETGYPNDMQHLGYDFHAPIGEAGQLRYSHALLRQQHAFLASFGSELVHSSPALPAGAFSSVYDKTNLRWAVRADGGSGFLFIAWHQPHDPLEPYSQAQFQVDLGSAGSVTLPDSPIDIPVGTLAWWPFNLDLGAAKLKWATASPVARLSLPDGAPAVVLLASPGIPVRFALPAGTKATGRVGSSLARIDQTTDGDVWQWAGDDIELVVVDGASLLLVPASQAHTFWLLDRPGGEEVWFSEADLAADGDRLVVRSETAVPVVRRFDTATGGLIRVPLTAIGQTPERLELPFRCLRPADPVPAGGYGELSPGRATAPTLQQVTELGAVWRIDLPEHPSPQTRLELVWEGDVANLCTIGGAVVDDDYWDGTPWVVNPYDLGLAGAIELLLLPLRPDAPVHVPAAAQTRRDQAAPAVLGELKAATLTTSGLWEAQT
ncbi:MAG: beta-galactosidase [Bifidobacteriaceae bacterium]|nr:beta-galactosidase [Bifidobacteriaceae bacterium]